MPEPQLSVIVPNYNYAHFLDETLSSVMAQTLQDWELVVIDDGSSDDSLAVIGLFQIRVSDCLRIPDMRTRACPLRFSLV